MQDDELDAAVAGDENANAEYAVTAALAGPPPPPEIFPEALAEQQAPEQGGTEREPADTADTAGTISVDEASRDELEDAVDAEGLDAKGTGSGGYVTTDDMKSALKGAGVTEISSR